MMIVPPATSRRAVRQLLSWRLFYYETDVLHAVLLAARAARVRVDATARAESCARRTSAACAPSNMRVDG
eukprot:4109398-Prymnesium_polylepis.1